jgi:hypothetical protein
LKASGSRKKRSTTEDEITVGKPNARKRWLAAASIIDATRLWKPLNPVAKIVERPVHPDEKQAFDRGSDGSGRRNQQNSGRLVGGNEAMEMNAHRSQIARDQDPAVFRRDPQDFRIESAIRNYARSRPEVYRGLPPQQSFPNVRIYVSVSLKTDLQASVGAASFLARSKRSIIS